MRKICHFFILSSLLLTLAGCMGSSFAPVDEGWQKPSDVGGVYQVKQGETLQDIAWRFNMNVKQLAKLNNLTAPYSLHKGQIIYLTAQAKAQGAQNPTLTEQSTMTDQSNNSSLSNTTDASESHLTPEPVQPENADKTAPAGAGGVTSMIGGASDNSKTQTVASGTKKGNWQWPISGQVVGNFSDGTKGMEIKGEPGEKVAASRGGQVVYAGNGLPGYGNLVIIKHPDGLMSVYAQNRKLLVKEGEQVQAGQTVAEVGDSSKLHFEIRKDGKPVDPSAYLGN